MYLKSGKLYTFKSNHDIAQSTHYFSVKKKKRNLNEQTKKDIVGLSTKYRRQVFLYFFNKCNKKKGQNLYSTHKKKMENEKNYKNK